MTTTRKYRYMRTDFAPLPVRLKHMDIGLDFRSDGRVHGSNTLHIQACEAMNEVCLDARDLEIQSIEWIGAAPAALGYEYRRTENRLIVKLPGRVEAGDSFAIRVRAVCVPSDNILEGLYNDTTPAGCPQQYMSQCQQWGFQRILP
jgi:aminopeptidase N